MTSGDDASTSATSSIAATSRSACNWTPGGKAFGIMAFISKKALISGSVRSVQSPISDSLLMDVDNDPGHYGLLKLRE